jgi:transcriptional regulator with GAF, ATPase, and Fis domain
VFPIETPPLRAHPEDIALIAARIVHHLCRRMHRPPLALAAAELAALEAHPWPGNVRELQNVLERAVISTPHTATHLQLPPLPQRTSVRPVRPIRPAPTTAPTDAPAGDTTPGIVLTDSELRRLQRENLVAALRAASGRVAGRGGAAELLGIKPSTLASRLRKLGIDPGASGS